MMNNKIYQAIFDEISGFLPNGWTDTIIYLEYGEDSYSFSFYVKVNGKFVKCYDLPGASEKKLEASFRRIDKIAIKARTASTKELWTNMTMSVKYDGSMHTDFDYTDLSTGAYRYKTAWKKRYLTR